MLAVGLLFGGAPASAPVAAAGSTALAHVTAVNVRLSFAAGRYTGYRFSSSGAVTGSRPYRLGRASSAPATRSATRAGKTYYYVSAGIWAGYWMPAGTGIRATSTAPVAVQTVAPTPTPTPTPAAATLAPTPTPAPAVQTVAPTPTPTPTPTPAAATLAPTPTPTPTPSAKPPVPATAAFTYPASGTTTTQHVGRHAITWTEHGTVTTRSITELYATAVSGSCGGVTWQVAWTRPDTASPFSISASVSTTATDTNWRSTGRRSR